jgi:hypothetical protein
MGAAGYRTGDARQAGEEPLNAAVTRNGEASKQAYTVIVTTAQYCTVMIDGA